MPAAPVVSIPPISPGEMQLLLSRAGLALNPGQVADLVLAWRQMAALIATVPRERPFADDMALGFLLPPPAVAPAARKPPAKAEAKAKTVPPKARKRPAGRNPIRRGR